MRFYDLDAKVWNPPRALLAKLLLARVTAVDRPGVLLWQGDELAPLL